MMKRQASDSEEGIAVKMRTSIHSEGRVIGFTSDFGGLPLQMVGATIHTCLLVVR